MRHRACLLFVLLAPGLAVAAERPNVVLVTLDTTRADRMGFLGSNRGLTPELDALARQATVFEKAFAQAPITTVSHATIFSGTYPQFHGVNDFGVSLLPSVPWLPESLRASGYRTAAFVGSLILDPRGGLAPGFDRGFDVYDAGFRVKRGREDRYATMERRGEDVVSRALSWLDGRPPGPFLLWVHLYDAHDPYEAPEPFRTRFANRPYDGEIAYADAQVGRLLAHLRNRGLLDATAVAVMADHGESLGEHGEATHGVFLYDATIRVPLLLKLPGARGAGQRVPARVSLVDVAPTLLEVAGVARPASVQGQSLLPLLAGVTPADRPSYAETDYPRRAFVWSSLASWRVEQLLYVRAPRPELYDVATDPGAERNLAAERAALAGRLGQQLEGFRRRTAAESSPAPARSVVDPALAEKLSALGYVSGGAAPVRASGIDPKDKVAVANALHDAILSLENGDTPRAATLLERVVATDPQIPMAQLQLGIARARQRRYREAIAPLRTAIELQPDSMQAHYEMGLVLFETGDLKTAAGHFEIVASRQPKWADARFSLASVYARIDRVPEAIAELEAALDLSPGHYRANLLLGRILTLQGQARQALPYLERAVAAEASSAEAHAFLADALQALGRTADADRARARSRRPPALPPDNQR
jgi:arylsulfatase A-like enzyme/cytochrome c-type biogenesis protein CcmH/NrfG